MLDLSPLAVPRSANWQNCTNRWRAQDQDRGWGQADQGHATKGDPSPTKAGEGYAQLWVGQQSEQGGWSRHMFGDEGGGAGAAEVLRSDVTANGGPKHELVRVTWG